MAHHHHHGDHHGHEHAHEHAHHVDGRSALGVALALNGIFLVIEAIAGWWIGSLALMSDAAHMISDVAALALASVAAQLSQRAAGGRASFGWRRAEVIGAVANAAVLVVVAMWIVVQAGSRLWNGGSAPDDHVMIGVGFAGLLVNLGSAWWLSHSDDGIGTRAALAHMLGDALGSVAAIVAGVAVGWGWPAADPLAGIAVGVLVGVSAVRLLREGVGVLLELSPRGVDVEQVGQALRGVDGVVGAHAVRVWSLDGRTPIASGHLVASAEADVDHVRHAASTALGRLGIQDVTLQVERSACPACHDGCAERA